jgi:hypothetical protein
MGKKTSVIAQLEFPEVPGLSLVGKELPSHRPKKLTGYKCQLVASALQLAGLDGLTPLEIEKQLDWKPGTAGPRLSELRSMGYARKTESRRNGSSIWLSTKLDQPA